jgi:hypothetical protein
LQGLFLAEVPAFAGMTEEFARMTVEFTGMTEEVVIPDLIRDP